MQYLKLDLVLNSYIHTSTFIEGGLSPSKKSYLIWFNESTLKVIKNVFYFILEALLDLKIFKVLSWYFWSYSKNTLIGKANFKIYDVTAWFTNNCPISHKVKKKQMIKLGQLIEYKVTVICLSKCRKWDRKFSSRPLYISFIWGESKWSIAYFHCI